MRICAGSNVYSTAARYRLPNRPVTDKREGMRVFRLAVALSNKEAISSGVETDAEVEVVFVLLFEHDVEVILARHGIVQRITYVGVCLAPSQYIDSLIDFADIDFAYSLSIYISSRATSRRYL